MEKQNNIKLDERMLATLSDGKQYIVIFKILLNSIFYVCLVENTKLDNIKFCIEEIEDDKIKLTEVEDMALRQILLKEFIKQYNKD